MELKEKIKAIRKAYHMTQSALAEIVGTNQTEISFMERGFIPENADKIRIIEELYESIES